MKKVDFETIRAKVKAGDYEISLHASERMRQRGLTFDDLEQVIIYGEIIERDYQAKPFPKCIFLGYDSLKGEAWHVVCSLTPQSRIVTVYFPDEDEWSQAKFRRK